MGNFGLKLVDWFSCGKRSTADAEIFVALENHFRWWQIKLIYFGFRSKINSAILELNEGGVLDNLAEKWFKDQTECDDEINGKMDVRNSPGLLLPRIFYDNIVLFVELLIDWAELWPVDRWKLVQPLHSPHHFSLCCFYHCWDWNRT